MDARYDDYTAAITTVTAELARSRRQARDDDEQPRSQDQPARGRGVAAGVVASQPEVSAGFDGSVGKLWRLAARLTRAQWFLVYAITTCVYVGAALGLAAWNAVGR
jgi:hypothetical protein